MRALLVIGTVGSIVAGWTTEPSFKVWLWTLLVALLIIWAATPTLIAAGFASALHALSAHRRTARA